MGPDLSVRKADSIKYQQLVGGDDDMVGDDDGFGDVPDESYGQMPQPSLQPSRS